jgi:hypothetical protein
MLYIARNSRQFHSNPIPISDFIVTNMPIRIKAFLYHLIGSMILAACALALVFLIWYPAPLAQASGVTNIFLLILGIDVIIGPILTLLVYKVGKKTLKFDLTTIIVLQLAMFSYGLHTVAIGRPAWLVFSIDQFYAVRPADVVTGNESPLFSNAQEIPWFGPHWVTVHLPDDKKARRKLVMQTLNTGRGIFMNPTLYRPLETNAKNIQLKAQPLSTLQQFNSPNAIKSTLAKFNNRAVSWLPLWSNPQSMTVLLDKNGHVVSIVDLNPLKQ